MSRRIIATPQQSFLDIPFHRMQRIMDAQAYRESPTGREENERLKAAFAAMIAATPLRLVVKCERNSWNYTLTLECGHEAGYYKPRESLRCHDCREQEERRMQATINERIRVRGRERFGPAWETELDVFEREDRLIAAAEPSDETEIPMLRAQREGTLTVGQRLALEQRHREQAAIRDQRRAEEDEVRAELGLEPLPVIWRFKS